MQVIYSEGDNYKEYLSASLEEMSLTVGRCHFQVARPTWLVPISIFTMSYHGPAIKLLIIVTFLY